MRCPRGCTGSTSFRTPSGCSLEVADLGVPRVHFGVGANHLAVDMAGARMRRAGVDFRVDLDQVDPGIRDRMPLPGNLDPAVLLTDEATIEAEVRRVLTAGRGLRGHVFNLGHGSPRHPLRTTSRPPCAAGVRGTVPGGS